MRSGHPVQPPDPTAVHSQLPQAGLHVHKSSRHKLSRLILVCKRLKCAKLQLLQLRDDT
jgi:hypothetical protein